MLALTFRMEDITLLAEEGPDIGYSGPRGWKVTCIDHFHKTQDEGIFTATQFASLLFLAAGAGEETWEAHVSLMEAAVEAAYAQVEPLIKGWTARPIP